MKKKKEKSRKNTDKNKQKTLKPNSLCPFFGERKEEKRAKDINSIFRFGGFYIWGTLEGFGIFEILRSGEMFRVLGFWCF